MEKLGLAVCIGRDVIWILPGSGRDNYGLQDVNDLDLRSSIWVFGGRFVELQDRLAFDNLLVAVNIR